MSVSIQVLENEGLWLSLVALCTAWYPTDRIFFPLYYK